MSLLHDKNSHIEADGEEDRPQDQTGEQRTQGFGTPIRRIIEVRLDACGRRESGPIENIFKLTWRNRREIEVRHRAC